VVMLRPVVAVTNCSSLEEKGDLDMGTPMCP
jgi:hypothetical protein